jgi:antitoxin CptB
MDDIRRKKIAFRAWHRGFREADLILGAFADARLASLDDGELDQFERLLEEADHDIYNWIIGRTPTPPEFETDIMSKLKQFRYEFIDSSDRPRGA